MSITKNQLEKSKYKDMIKYFITNHDFDKLIHNVKIVKFADLDQYESIAWLRKCKFAVKFTSSPVANFPFHFSVAKASF
jgi:hypothetical protein